MQTEASHFRRDNETQVYLPKEKNSQTKRDRGTNPPIVTTYIAGFRGKKMLTNNDDDSKNSVYDKNTNNEYNNLKLKL
jgi:hypothetical protein